MGGDRQATEQIADLIVIGLPLSATGGRVQNTLQLLAHVSVEEAQTPRTKQP